MLFYFSRVPASIGVGIVSDHINVWRYWEKTDTGYQYKMIIFNISDSAVTFKLEQRVINDATKKKMWIPEITINKSAYKIYDVPFLPDEYLSFYANDIYLGILPMENFSYPVNTFQTKFISDEGLNGSSCGCWVTKNNLFSDKNSTDTIVLHLNYVPKVNLDKSGVYKLELKPSREYESFSVRINSSPAGAFNVKGHYKIELPYQASEYVMKGNKYNDSNPETDIEIIYSVKLSGKMLLGLEFYSKIVAPDEKMVHEVKYYRTGAGELPVMIK